MIGAFSCVMALLVLVAVIWTIVKRVRDWRLDSDIRRAFKEADRLGLLEKRK